MPLSIPSLIYPVFESALLAGRELTINTPPSAFTGIPCGPLQTSQHVNWLGDENLRGSNVKTYSLVQANEWAEVTVPASPAYGDTLGHILFSMLGDYTSVGTAATPNSTLSGGVSAGATTLNVVSGTGFAANQWIQVDTTTLAEIVQIQTVVTNTITLTAATPLRFSHLTGVAVTNTAANYCVDVDTEILTADGWKTVHGLREGDEVLTYNHATGLSEWQPVQEVCIFPYADREMILMEGKAHSSLTTPNHRWPVLDRKDGRVWRTSETLVTGDRIPRAAMCADLPAEPKYTDAFVELVAWFWTEGTIRSVSNVAIFQSRKNSANVDRIDAALQKVIGAPLDELDRGSTLPQWRRKYDGRNEHFILNAVAGKMLLEVAPGRVVTREFLRSLTQAQLDLFIKISMLADNCGPTRLAQRNREAAEAFQFAAILAGYATSLIERVYKRDGLSMWGVTLQNRKWITPVDSARMAKRHGGGWSISRVRHDGIVWCPRTENKSWYARRNGNCYFTGNTHTFSAINPNSSTGNTSAQPPTYTFLHRNLVATAANHNSDQYTYSRFTDLKLTANRDGWFTWDGKFTSYLRTFPSTDFQPTFTNVKAFPSWQAAISLAAGQVYNVSECHFDIKRELDIVTTSDGSQAPYVIAAGPLTAEFGIDYDAVSDETALNYMLNNTQPTLSFVLTNGLSSPNTVSITINAQLTGHKNAPLSAMRTLWGFKTTGELVANVTNSGNSGGYGPVQAVLVNQIPSY